MFHRTDKVWRFIRKLIHNFDRSEEWSVYVDLYDIADEIFIPSIWIISKKHQFAHELYLTKEILAALVEQLEKTVPATTLKAAYSVLEDWNDA